MPKKCLNGSHKAPWYESRKGRLVCAADVLARVCQVCYQRSAGALEKNKSFSGKMTGNIEMGWLCNHQYLSPGLWKFGYKSSCTNQVQPQEGLHCPLEGLGRTQHAGQHLALLTGGNNSDEEFSESYKSHF